MGQEASCILRLGKHISRGTILLESAEIIFRGDPRLVIPFKGMKSVKAAGAELQVQYAGGLARFEIGPSAAKWAHKILNPPSLLDKLGVKAGMRISVLGGAAKSFHADLKKRGAVLSVGKPAANSDLIIFGAARDADLKRIDVLRESLEPAGGIWIVYPKGRKEITENAVIGAGRAAGLKDVKVCSFSTTHTALKFVIPVSRRA